MQLDCTKYPQGYTFAAAASEALGLYVKVADFTMAGDTRIFRMIIDPEINKKQLRELMFSSVKDAFGSYDFHHLESIAGPVVDQGPRVSPYTTYIRVTFM